jgi:hypothetical protein
MLWRRKSQEPIKDELLAQLEIKDETIEMLKDKIDQLSFELGTQKKITAVHAEKNESLRQQIGQKDNQLTRALNLLAEVKVTLSNGQVI